MAFLVRSLAVATVLLAALVAVFITSKDDTVDNGIRRRLSEDLHAFSNVDIKEVELNTAQVPERNVQRLLEEEPPLVSPDEFDVESIEKAQIQQELEIIAHDYEESVIQAQMLEDQALYEIEQAQILAEQGETEEDREKAAETDLEASDILQEAEVQEMEMLQEGELIQEQLDGATELANERRRVLKVAMQARGMNKATLNGIEYDAFEKE